VITLVRTVEEGIDAYKFPLIDSLADPFISLMPFKDTSINSRKGYIQGCTTRK